MFTFLVFEFLEPQGQGQGQGQPSPSQGRAGQAGAGCPRANWILDLVIGSILPEGQAPRKHGKSILLVNTSLFTICQCQPREFSSGKMPFLFFAIVSVHEFYEAQALGAHKLPKPGEALQSRTACGS